MSTLLERLSKAGSIKAPILSESAFFNEKEQIPTDIPIINLALSGKIRGGLTSGLTFLAGPSRHFKSLLGLILVRAYMKAHPDAVCLFYDSEFGITQNYVLSNGIDPDRVIHIPILHVENLKFDIAKRLEEIKRGDKVVIFIDSVGNLASKKEAEDAINENSAADMSRAKSLKSLWRIVTPHLTTKDIPCIAVNHTYEEQKMYGKTIMSGGTGGMYSAMQVFIIGKAQEKDGTNLLGYNFTINIDKSRFVKEKSKFLFTVKFKGGINRWSGLLDLALESGHVVKPKNARYSKVDMETGEFDEKGVKEELTNNKEFWTSILQDPKFNDFVEQKYLLARDELMETEDEVDDVMDSIEEDE